MASSYLDPPTVEDDRDVPQTVGAIDAHAVSPKLRQDAWVGVPIPVRLPHALHGDTRVDRCEEGVQRRRAAVVRHLQDGGPQIWAFVTKQVGLVLLLLVAG